MTMPRLFISVSTTCMRRIPPTPQAQRTGSP